MLVNRGANVEPTSRGSHNSYVHYATNIGREKIINLLLSKGANVNVKNANGETALHCGNKDREFTKLLSNFYHTELMLMPVTIRNGYIPLHFAAET